MYQPTTRLLTVLELLQARPVLSGSELARRLDVDGRTVRRYVMMLQDMGIPVEAVQGRYGGYRLRPGFKIPPLLFTEEEALAVTLGLMAARTLGLTSTAPAIEGALAKVERVLPAAVGERIRATQEVVGFTHAPPAAAPAASDVLLTLTSAAQRLRRVWLRYRDREGVESAREVDPYGLVFHYGRWYLVALDQRSGELRTFRLDRVQSVDSRDATFERPRDFDARTHLLRALASVPWGWDIKVLLSAELAQVRQRIAADIANLEQTSEGVLLTTQADDLRYAARLIVGLGVPFVVLRPAELKVELHKLAEEVIGYAQREETRLLE
jgi:predicted DNA-binding transcriptional regulator YafY